MKSDMIFFTLFISIFYIVGFYLLGKGIHSYIKGQSSLNWPTTKAEIVELHLKEDHDSDGTDWEVKIDYDYKVERQIFTNDNLAFGYSGSGDKEYHEEILQKLKRGNKVTIRYNPKDPSESVIATGFNKSTFYILAFAITWLLFVIGFTVMVISQAKTDTSIINQIEVSRTY